MDWSVLKYILWSILMVRLLLELLDWTWCVFPVFVFTVWCNPVPFPSHRVSRWASSKSSESEGQQPSSSDRSVLKRRQQSHCLPSSSAYFCIHSSIPIHIASVRLSVIPDDTSQLTWWVEEKLGGFCVCRSMKLHSPTWLPVTTLVYKPVWQVPVLDYWLKRVIFNSVGGRMQHDVGLRKLHSCMSLTIVKHQTHHTAMLLPWELLFLARTARGGEVWLAGWMPSTSHWQQLSVQESGPASRCTKHNALKISVFRNILKYCLSLYLKQSY